MGDVKKMIIFSGLGIILVPLFGITGFTVTTALRIVTWGSNNMDSAAMQPLTGLYFIVGGIVAGALCWVVGRKLNVKKVLVDKATGKEVVLGSRHSLMFIPLEYYGFIFPILFAWLGFTLYLCRVL